MLGIDTDAVQGGAGRYRLHPLFDGHLGFALHDPWRAARWPRPASGSPERIRQIGAGLLQVDPAAVRLEGGRVGEPVGQRDARRRWGAPGISARRTSRRTPIRQGLEVVGGYKPARDSGTFSYASHAAVVAVDTATGEVEILDYVGGRGRRRAGQPDDRRRPGPWRHRPRDRPRRSSRRCPTPRTASRSRPRSRTTCCRGRPRSPRSRSITWRPLRPTPPSARRGSARAGRSDPPAAIANAVNDALAPLGVSRVSECPITPRRLLAAIAAAAENGDR